MWNYRNPVRIEFGAGRFGEIAKAIAGRPYCLVTYPDAVFTTMTERLVSDAGAPTALVRDVEPNPGYESLTRAAKEFAAASKRPEVIVALGGGSAMDTAKVVAASDGDFARVRNYVESGKGADKLGRIPIIAVPTTAGTGSEVTCWATVWDTRNKKKYSLALPELYPEVAILDPEVTLGIPRALTVSTGLDALSHALESLWNTNANPVSANCAVFAAQEVLECLPALSKDLHNLELRSRLMRASLFAGLAFSNTKTALAHSMSYHFTLHHGVPHGIACSFSLPLVMKSAIGRGDLCDGALKRIFGHDLDAGVKRLEDLLDGLGVSRRPGDHGVDSKIWLSVIDDAFDGERGRNFIGSREAMFHAARFVS